MEIEDEAYEKFHHAVVRDLNALTEQDRNVRRNALKRLVPAFVTKRTAETKHVTRAFVGSHKVVCKCFADPTDKCRELALELTKGVIPDLTVEELKDILALLLAAIVQRFRTTPFPEQTEELRLELLVLLEIAVDRAGAAVAPYSHDLLDCLSRALTDTCPEAKKAACSLVERIVKVLPTARIASAKGTKPLVQALLAQLKHQRWKIRQSSLSALGSLLADPELLAEYLEDVVGPLGVVVHDANPLVRKELSGLLHAWLLRGIKERKPAKVDVNADNSADDDVSVRQFFDWRGMGDWESRLLTLLLGLSEDEIDLVPLAESLAAAKHAYVLAEIAKRKHRRETNEFVMLVDEAGVELKETAHPLATWDKGLARFHVSAAPSPVLSWYMKWHMPSLMPRILPGLLQWTADLRSSSAKLTLILLALGHEACLVYADQVLQHLYRALQDDEPAMWLACEEAARFLGALDLDPVLGLVLSHVGATGDFKPPSRVVEVGGEELYEEEKFGRVTTRTEDWHTKAKRFLVSGDESRKALLKVVARLAEACSSPRDVERVVVLLESQLQFLPELAAAAASVLGAVDALSEPLARRLFGLLVRAQATGVAVDAAMERLGVLASMTVVGLYEVHLARYLDDVLQAPLWDEDIQRQLLESLVKCSSAKVVAPELKRLLPLLATQTDPEDAMPSARGDLLGLIYHLLVLESPEIHDAWVTGEPSNEDVSIGIASSDLPVRQTHGLELVRRVLVPNTTWKPGQANSKIRKAGLVCLNEVTKRKLLGAVELRACFHELMPILKNVMDDSWSPDNRLLGVLVLDGVLKGLFAETTPAEGSTGLDGEILREVYPELLKRLDDSNDAIRLAACSALRTFFDILSAVPNWGSSVLQYILKTLFIHLDDPSSDMQDAMATVLEGAAHVCPQLLLQEARSAVGKSCHPRKCEELARLAESLNAAETF